jgi:hypothetical protein
MMQIKASIRQHMPRLRSLAARPVTPFYRRLRAWVIRTRDSTDPLALDDEESDDDEISDECNADAAPESGDEL